MENELSNDSKKFDVNGQDNNELSIKNETERQSEINDEENLADNNSEVKEGNLEQVEERGASKVNESLKLTETNDENKPDDENDEERENQLWKFQDSDEE
ncbi:hypothetical protein BpHYR1_011803 [Brachionus plicatilis]|uniref:Uncharacterized protein n=1 Tax=Brachionus plicatilis TaxID=10195 RepID=A0A3M7PGV6_BRAPC|nr:hypothetical protein BpHYR1_011803 [Brachionus plicatilis]